MSVCLSVCLSICSSVCLSICLSICSSVCLSICLFVCLFVHLFVCLFVHLFICLFVHLFVCLFVHLFVCLFVHLFICLFVCLSIRLCLSVYPSVCLSVCPCVCLSVCSSIFSFYFILPRESILCAPTNAPSLDEEDDLTENKIPDLDIYNVENIEDPLSKVQAGLQYEGETLVPLQSVHIRAKLLDLCAKVVVMQVYKNPSEEAIEAKYVFPLDDMAAGKLKKFFLKKP